MYLHLLSYISNSSTDINIDYDRSMALGGTHSTADSSNAFIAEA